MTPAPSPCEENGCTDTDNCDEICEHSRIYSPIQIEDAKKQAAARAREKVLDELIETIKEDFTEDFDGDLTITYGDFLFNVQSLRTEAHKQPKEQAP